MNDDQKIIVAAQLGPGKVGVDPAAEAAIRAGNDVFAA